MELCFAYFKLDIQNKTFGKKYISHSNKVYLSSDFPFKGKLICLTGDYFLLNLFPFNFNTVRTPSDQPN